MYLFYKFEHFSFNLEVLFTSRNLFSFNLKFYLQAKIYYGKIKMKKILEDINLSQENKK